MSWLLDRPCRLSKRARSLAGILLVASIPTLAMAQSRKAVSVAASEPNMGLNIVRDDGRVVSYWDVTYANGPRVIPGLENIVATTARLALRRDGVVLTWRPKCGVDSKNPTDVEHEYCEFPAARPVAGLRNIVAIAEYGQCHLALDRDGAVWGWGNDSDGLISGQPAIPHFPGKPYKRRVVSAPTRIPLPVPMVAISAGTAQAGAIDREGRVWTWGGGRFPELLAPGEDGAGPNGFVARRITGLPPIRAIDVFTTAYAIAETGELWRWGVSAVNGQRRGSTTPSRVADLTNTAAVSHVSFFTAIMKHDGAVLFIGLAPDVRSGRFIDELQASNLASRAKFISGSARITIDGEVFWFNDIRRGGVRRLELGD